MVRELECLLLGHRYQIKRVISRNIKEVECIRCGREWGLNQATASLVPMDEELAKLHRETAEVTEIALRNLSDVTDRMDKKMQGVLHKMELYEKNRGKKLYARTVALKRKRRRK